MGMDTTPVLQIKGKEVNQMDMKLVDSEIKVMDVLWKEGDSMAKHVADVMKERYGWNVNTTYTPVSYTHLPDEGGIRISGSRL